METVIRGDGKKENDCLINWQMRHLLFIVQHYPNSKCGQQAVGNFQCNPLINPE